MLEKIILPDVEKSSRISPIISFTQKRPAGKNILKVQSISKSFGDKILLNNVSFNIARGEKVVIIGPNGIGKSTFLKIILGLIGQDQGCYEFGYETHISYFSQDHHDILNQNMTILEWLIQNANDKTENMIRSVLGQLLFKQDDVFKNLLKLSGGEGARLLISKMVLEMGNLLILDEPTNHLDIEAEIALGDALKSYSGTVIMVTHDRDFAAKIATRILAITQKKIIDFHGTYDEYLNKHKEDYFKS